MVEIVDVLEQDYLTIVGFAGIFNIALMLGSFLLYFSWHAIKKNHFAVNEVQPIVSSDYWAVLCTLVCNVLVFIFGAFLWKEGYLEVDFTALNAGKIAKQLLVLILVVDFWMYVFHKLAHSKWLYPLIHQRHHEHVSVNVFSLFVLSPFESLGFGLMLIAILMSYPFHYISVGLYFLINVIWGTIGHFNRVGRVAHTGWTSWLGTASFHNTHHLKPHANFGFYTTIWDRLFHTHKKE